MMAVSGASSDHTGGRDGVRILSAGELKGIPSRGDQDIADSSLMCFHTVLLLSGNLEAGSPLLSVETLGSVSYYH